MLEEISLMTVFVQKAVENKFGNTGGEYEGGKFGLQHVKLKKS